MAKITFSLELATKSAGQKFSKHSEKYLRYNTFEKVMLKKTISKNLLLVISCLALAANFSACFSAASKDGKQKIIAASTPKSEKDYKKAQIVGRIATDEVTESSGIVASKCQESVFWTHNDSGDGAFVFAINAKGKKLGTFRVKGAKNVDWEDIAAYKNAGGECFLYIGDIGDNARARNNLGVYLIKEPQIHASDASSNKKKPTEISEYKFIKVAYPDSRHDAETLLVHPQTADIYIVTKELSTAAGVYKLAGNYESEKTNKLEKITNLSVPAIPNGFLTGGNISSDGKKLIVCDYFAAYEFALPENAKNFEEIWKQKPLTVSIGERAQGEAICYSLDGKSIFATSEKKNSPIFEARQN